MSLDRQFGVNLWDIWTLIFSHHCDNINYVWFFTWAYIGIFFPYTIQPFWLLVTIWINHNNFSTQQVIVAPHMCSFLKVTNSPGFIFINYFNFNRWFPFSFCIWSAVPDFSISPNITAFWCFSNIIFHCRHILPSYVLPPL